MTNPIAWKMSAETQASDIFDLNGLLLKTSAIGDGRVAGTLIARTRSAAVDDIITCPDIDGAVARTKRSRTMDSTQFIDMYIVICDETCSLSLYWAIVVLLAPSSFDFLTGWPVARSWLSMSTAKCLNKIS